MSEKEELYEFPKKKSNTKKRLVLKKERPILTKQVFLETLSKVYKKPITIRDLSDVDKDVLNQILENQRAFREKLEQERNKPITPPYYQKTRSRVNSPITQRKKMRIESPYEKKRKMDKSPTPNQTRKKTRSEIVIPYSKKASPIQFNLTASKKPNRKTRKSKSKSKSPISSLVDKFKNMTI